MASKYLLCGPCSRKPLVAEEHGSHTFYAWGKSKLTKPTGPIEIVDLKTKKVEQTIEVAAMACDFCSALIQVGDVACAWTFWTDPEQPDLGWRDQYLDEVTETQRHDW